MYEVYAHKQAPHNMTESPQSDISFSSNANLNASIVSTNTAGLIYAGTRVYGAGKQILNTAVKTSGNKRTIKTVERVSRGIGFALEVKSFGLKGALLVEALSFGVEVFANERQNEIDTINQNYNIQKRGVAVNKFTGVGERID